MADIKITREHNLGLDKALAHARGLVDGLAEKYGLKTSWSNTGVTVKHGLTGITGTLEVTDKTVTVIVELSFLQSAFKGVIESTINSILAKELI